MGGRDPELVVYLAPSCVFDAGKVACFPRSSDDGADRSLGIA